MEQNKMIYLLKDRFQIEAGRQDRSGVYALTQRKLAYNSNRIEGSTLTEKQTASIFETGTIRADGSVFRTKDVEEMTGHFTMFNYMLSTCEERLNQELIKAYHYRLKAGVFEDIANGYPIGEYKNRRNMVSDITTSSPENVAEDMELLLESYHEKEPHDLEDLAEFHAKFEKIHPFQDAHVIIGTRLEKPSKINGFALLSPNFFMPERGERNHHTSTYIAGQQYESLIAIKATIPSFGDGFEGPKSL